MANTSVRGGKKNDGGKHQGVRKGSTATRRERHQVEKRKPVIEEQDTSSRSKRVGILPVDQPAKRRKGAAANKLRKESPEKRSQIKAGTGKKNVYANMPKARKVR
jgi:hypothetical protein